MHLSRRWVSCTLFLAAGCLLQLPARAADDTVDRSVKSFTSVYDLVERNFADKIPPATAVYKGAIPGMLRTLDPHSNFLDTKEYADQRERQKAQYFGIGINVLERGGNTQVLWPFEGSPAYKAGIRPGDVIAAINGTPAYGMNSVQVADKLRGPRGTKVEVTVARGGSDRGLTFAVSRDAIARSCVPQAFWLKQGIAYVGVSEFSCETTSRDFEDKLKQLGEDKIEGLILDLRGNPGGLVTDGVDVAGHFLRKGDLVVSDHGRAQPNQNFLAKGSTYGMRYPIVVMVNRNSASASEIVTGALQDHDRAWILGETTFGKGLVQQPYPLGDKTALLLTIAHYYTPSGRLIQRDYSNVSLLDYRLQNNSGGKNLDDVKMTDSGRTVYGGGGITPDEKYEEQRFNRVQRILAGSFLFFDFAVQSFNQRTDLRLPAGWEPDEELVNQFHDFLTTHGPGFTDADFAANRAWIRQQLKREFYVTGFSYERSQQVAIEQDPEIARAIESMPKAISLFQAAQKLIVQRMSQPRVVAR
jgi:carboxyl-terminal processing protease